MREPIFAVPIALLAAISGLGQTRITAVRFWSVGDVTRVAIETDGETHYRAEQIDNPDRLFLDLQNTRPQSRGLETISVGDRLLKQIRIARTLPSVTRVVLDLAAPIEYSVSHLTNPDRIMVELRVPGKGPATPPLRSVTGNHPIPEPGPVEAEKEPGAKPALAPSVVIPKPDWATLRLPPPRVVESRPAPEPPSLPAVRISEHKPLPEALRTPAPPVAESKPAPDPPHASVPRVAESRPLAEAPRPRTEPKSVPETALAAKRDSHGGRSMIRALGLKLGRVVLDPGHGGQDTGTVGPGGLEEKTLVLDVAQRLGALIAQRLGSEVVYTRTDDRFVPLEARTELANEKRADLFLSIHANSSRLRGISGSEAYYLNFTTSASALEVAARENASSEKSIHELQNLLQKIALKEKVQESREFAATIQTSLYAGLWRGKAVKNRGVKQAPFVVLIGAQMPSVLAEIAFLSNPRDEAQLKRGEYRQRVAEALFKGVAQYASTLSHFQVARGKGAEAQP
ncbi:MAG: N-acetylmuramoyl-L-alanine amidase [Bryobacteraceae bacterium]|jgi:N-acetylmuramoyl-L-alanine amidase